MTEDEAKDFVADNIVYPDYTLAPMIEKADAGCVVWDPVPPQGVSYQTHKISFIDAIMTGLKFCDTNCLHDWAVLGPSALAVVRTLEMFVAQPERSNGKMNFVGTLAQVKIYAYPTAEDDQFWVGTVDKCCVGVIEDHCNRDRQFYDEERRRVLEHIIHQQLGG